MPAGTAYFSGVAPGPTNAFGSSVKGLGLDLGHSKKPKKPQAPKRDIESIEVLKLPPVLGAVERPSYYNRLYARLEEIMRKSGEGLKVTKTEGESLRRWCAKEKLPVIVRKLGDDLYGAWAPKKE